MLLGQLGDRSGLGIRPKGLGSAAPRGSDPLADGGLADIEGGSDLALFPALALEIQRRVAPPLPPIIRPRS